MTKNIARLLRLASQTGLNFQSALPADHTAVANERRNSEIVVWITTLPFLGFLEINVLMFEFHGRQFIELNT